MKIPIIGHIEVAFPAILQFILLLVIAVVIAIVCIGIQKILEQIPFFGPILFGEYNAILRKKEL